ncbi:MAG TPA: phage portal protein [Blastococcus sp.]|nr:phage portal protein [Nocardioides sp.]HYH26957.1 phage portal protein [Blastococcus sp.]
MLSPQQAVKLVKDQLYPGYDADRQRLARIDHWYRWEQEDIPLPRKATPELKRLAELSRVPWLSLVVTSCAQAMYVDGFRSELDPSNDRAAGEEAERQASPPWRTWLANAMDRRQIALHRAALAYGWSFAKVLPGEDPVTGRAMSAIRGVSPRKMYALWEDPAEDDWPRYTMQVIESRRDGEMLVRVLDDTAEHELRIGDGGTDVHYLDQPRIHDAGVCPVVRFANMLDLEGRSPGEVEPHIAIAARINKTSYDRLLTQHFNSWKVRTVAGMAEPDDEEVVARKKLQLRQDDLLVAEDPDTKFGSLDETPLEGFISAHRADVETLAAVSQTPTHELTGQMANLSAEALAAARASLNQKVTERQKSFGASHAQMLRLAVALEGDESYAGDPTGRVTWQDMEIRSMSQAADALGKMAEMLHVPPTALWALIPGVEKTDVAEWIRLAEEGDPITKLQQQMERQRQEREIRAKQAAPAAQNGQPPTSAQRTGAQGGRAQAGSRGVNG